MKSASAASRDLEPDSDDFLEFYRKEVAAGWLYRQLADLSEGKTARTLLDLAQAEDRHAAHWRDLLERRGVPVPATSPGPAWRDRALVRIARLFGVNRVLPFLIRFEAADANVYLHIDEAPRAMAEEEMEHGRRLMNAAGISEAGTITRFEPQHRVGTGNALRAATFGFQDGLVSNLGLVMGVAGGSGNPSLILLAGLAGMVASALSMAAGEWISVQSMRELYRREIAIERDELRYFPEEERRELIQIYRSKGAGREQAEMLASTLMEDEDAALDTLVREELGLDPAELASPWVAAGSSWIAVAIGGFIPVLPWILGTGRAALFGSIISALVALGTAGAVISILTGRNMAFSAMRMLLIGCLTAGTTYLIGTLIGAAI